MIGRLAMIGVSRSGSVIDFKIRMATEKTAESLIVPVKNQFPFFFCNHRLVFYAAGYADPLIPFFRFK
ncbi:MAG: hypothetical protein ACD_75C00052G0003 [uncultured bacterium]|nr:MAG: hypothetical protein ACD_75C00052G0003 [uncultured bacterium]